MPPMKTRRKRFKEPGPKTCHPRMKGSNGSCLTDDILQTLATTLQAPTGLRKQQLRDWIRERTRCKTERCWVEKTPLEPDTKKRILKGNFRPAMPDSWQGNMTEWLDTNDINAVMKQYEEAYPNFKYYGTNPIDFSAPNPYIEGSKEKKICLQDEICKLNLKDMLQKGIEKIGFVYNLDPSDKEGSHWIASFIDIPAKKHYYFDSYGMKPPHQVARFMKALTLQEPSMRLFSNARRFQFGHSECGMYCLYFIIRMLEGDSFRDFCRNMPTDADIKEMKKWLYSSKD
jgi:hypothetical protein